MDWTDIAAIVFTCVTANHLGLVPAVEDVIRHRLPVLDCPRCLTFWTVLAYGLSTMPCGSPQDAVAAMPRLLAISLLCSYLAVWLELIEGLIDKLYDYIYEQIYPATDSTADDAPGA